MNTIRTIYVILCVINLRGIYFSNLFTSDDTPVLKVENFKLSNISYTYNANEIFF